MDKHELARWLYVEEVLWLNDPSLPTWEDVDAGTQESWLRVAARMVRRFYLIERA